MPSAIGLLPGFRQEQVRVVGNTALAGALLALVDRTTLDEMENLRTQVEVIELNLAAASRIVTLSIWRCHERFSRHPAAGAPALRPDSRTVSAGRAGPAGGHPARRPR